MEPVSVARPVKVAPRADPITDYMDRLRDRAANIMNGMHAASFQEFAAIVRHVDVAERALGRAWQAIDRARTAID